MLEPALVGIGLTSITTIASIAGVTAAIKDFAGTARDLSFVSKETGLAVDQLRAFEAAGENVGISTGAMRNSLKALNEELAQNKMHRGALREFSASQTMNPEARALAERLRHTKDEAESISIIMDTLANSSQATKHIMLEALHLPPEFSRLTKKDLKEVGEILGNMPKAYLSNGLALQHSFDMLRLRAQALRDTIGGELAPAMMQMTEAVRKFVEEHGEDLRKILLDVAGAVRDAPWKEWGNDIRDAAKSVDGVVQSIGGWKLVMEGLIAIKLVNFVAPVVTLGLAATRTAASLAAMGATLAGLTAPAWLLALLAGVSAKALIETVRPQPLNKGEDELARQKKYGLAPKDEDKGVRAAARAIRKKIEAPADEATAPARKGSAMPISYGGDTGAASFRREDAGERAILKGTYEGTRTGVLAAFKEWVESRRQGYGDANITNANYQPGASGGMGGGAGAPEGTPGAPEKPSASQGRTPLPNIAQPPAVTTPAPQVPSPNITPRIQAPAPAPTTPATPTTPHGATPRQPPRPAPSEAAAAEAMREFGKHRELPKSGWWTGEHIRHAVEFLKKRGLTDLAAKGLVSRWAFVEAPRGPGDSNAIGGGHWGIAQWGLKRGGRSMKNASFDEQLNHAADELDSNESRAKRILNAAKSAEEAARGASAFERAEHWNPATNTDIGTAKTARGVAEIKRRIAKEYASKSKGTANENETSGGMHEWIAQQRDGAHHQHRPWDGRIGHHHRQPLSADLGRYIANSVGITSQAHKVTGDASLKISLAGFPKGTKTQSQISGLFKTLTMYRGLAAPMADQEG